MDYDSIRQEMSKITITFDHAIINQVVSFLKTYFARNPLQNISYQVAAATAIACESIKLPTMVSHCSTGSGITIETIMRNIGCLSKE